MVLQILGPLPFDLRVAQLHLGRPQGRLGLSDASLRLQHHRFGGSHRRIAAILLEVDRGALEARITGRRVCPSCGRSYHIVNRPPAVTDTCDACGAGLVVRGDDAPATVAARLANQLEALGAVVDHYRASDRLSVVDGEGPIAEVQSRLAAAAAAAGLAR